MSYRSSDAGLRLVRSYQEQPQTLAAKSYNTNILDAETFDLYIVQYFEKHYSFSRGVGTSCEWGMDDKDLIPPPLNN